MSVSFTLTAELREDQGKGASRRLRHSGNVPAIIYGGTEAPQAITLNANEVNKHLMHEAFYSHILTMTVGKSSQQVILRDVQRHPYRPQITHMDFLRVTADHEIHVNVPLHFVGEEACIGVKQQGGVITHVVGEVNVACLPKDLPEYIEVDMSAVEVGHAVHLSDIKVPKGVRIIELSHGHEHDVAVAAVNKPRGSDDSATEGTDEAAS